MEHHSSNGEYPAIEVIVSRGKEDICVKVIYKSCIDFENDYLKLSKH